MNAYSLRKFYGLHHPSLNVRVLLQMIVSNKGQHRITLTVSSSVENISPLAEALHALCLYASNNDTLAMNVQLAVVEALNNVILHAYNNQAGNEITVQWCLEQDHIRIEIIDDGCSMTYLPPPVLPEFDAENSRGWWIIKSCIDDYFYKVVECVERERIYHTNGTIDYTEVTLLKSHKNILTLIKKL